MAELPNCPLCDGEPHATLLDGGYKWFRIECSGCGLGRGGHRTGYKPLDDLGDDDLAEARKDWQDLCDLLSDALAWRWVWRECGSARWDATKKQGEFVEVWTPDLDEYVTGDTLAAAVEAAKGESDD